MSSGKRSKQRRRPPPPPPVSSRPRRASPRVLLAGGGAGLAAVVAIVLAVVLGGGSSQKTASTVPRVGSLANALPGAAAVQRLFAGIPQRGTTLGSPGAPITLVVYVDLQCPFCKELETQVMPGIVRRYVRPGKLRIVLRPWAFIGPDSVRGQAAVLAAARQDKAFDLAEVLYDNQGTENSGWLDRNMVVAAASSVPGLRVRKLLADMSSASVQAAAAQVASLVEADGVQGTPTVFVGKTGRHGSEVVLPSATDAAPLVRAIRTAGG